MLPLLPGSLPVALAPTNDLQGNYGAGNAGTGVESTARTGLLRVVPGSVNNSFFILSQLCPLMFCFQESVCNCNYLAGLWKLHSHGS